MPTRILWTIVRKRFYFKFFWFVSKVSDNELTDLVCSKIGIFLYDFLGDELTKLFTPTLHLANSPSSTNSWYKTASTYSKACFIKIFLQVGKIWHKLTYRRRVGLWGPLQHFQNDLFQLKIAAVIWLKYCRYGDKHYPINQLIRFQNYNYFKTYNTCLSLSKLKTCHKCLIFPSL